MITGNSGGRTPFSQVVTNGCIFSRRAVIRFADPAWDFELGISENIIRVTPSFLAFVQSQCEPQAPDAWVLAIPDTELVSDVQALAATTKSVLCEMTRQEDSSRDLLTEDIADPAWQLTWYGMDWFLVAFAPCYPPSHPRFSHSSSGYLMIQPVISFERFGVIIDPKSYPLRRRIRDDFARRGLPLDEALMETTVMAQKFVKPRHIGDHPVEWWN